MAVEPPSTPGAGRPQTTVNRAFTVIGWLTTSVALIVGLPLFLRMPPWCDLTLYDMAAANLLAGGVHYRDVFDTNLPGFVWFLTLIQWLLGPSVEAVRCADFAIVVGIVFLLDRLAKSGGATHAARAWFVAGVALFYPYTSEFNHAQRDVWMMLPALGATMLRWQNRAAFWQGVLWGCAVWIKPHVVIPAAVVWLAGVPRLPTWKAVLFDALWHFAGGGLIGLLGVGYLVASGTWPHFVEVFTFWNSGYARVMQAELPDRLMTQFLYFPPWGYWQIVTVPLAIYFLVQGCWPTGRNHARMLLAALYLGWTAQALLVQRCFHYVHIPEVFLLLSLGAQARLPLGAVMAVWLAFTSTLIGFAGYPEQRPHPGQVRATDSHVWCLRHPLTDPERLQKWPECFLFGLSADDYYTRMDSVAMIRDFFPANDWAQLNELAEELQRRGVTDGQVIAWDDAPHAVYRLAGVRPGFRFMHVRAMMTIGPEHAAQIVREYEAIDGVKYIVADLRRLGYEWPGEIGDRSSCGPDLLPVLSPDVRTRFPYTLKAVYRTKNSTGRYVLMTK